MASTGRKYTTYGKQRMKIGTSNRDWLASVNGGSAVAKETGYTQSPTWQAHRRAEGGEAAVDKASDSNKGADGDAARSWSVASKTHVIDQQDNNKHTSDSEDAVEQDNGVIDLSEDIPNGRAALRERVISLSSESSSSSVEVIQPRKRTTSKGLPTKPQQKRIFVIDSPPSSPAPVESVAQPTTPYVKASNSGKARPKPLGRKDSNNASVGQARAAAAAFAKDGKKRIVDGKALRRASSTAKDTQKADANEEDTTEGKENLPLPAAYNPTSKKGKPSISESKQNSYKTPFPTFPSSSSQASAKAPLVRNLILSSPRKPASPNKASSSGLNSLQLPPPRGHGSNATAPWRRPLTPIVVPRRNGLGDPAFRERKRVESPLKAKRGKVAIEMEVPVVVIAKGTRRSSASPGAVQGKSAKEKPLSSSGHGGSMKDEETSDASLFQDSRDGKSASEHLQVDPKSRGTPTQPLTTEVSSTVQNSEALNGAAASPSHPEEQGQSGDTEEARAVENIAPTSSRRASSAESSSSTSKRRTRRSAANREDLPALVVVAEQSNTTSPPPSEIPVPSAVLVTASSSAPAAAKYPTPTLSALEIPDEILPLLISCSETLGSSSSLSSTSAFSFSSFIEACPLFPCSPGSPSSTAPSVTWKKLGEATYSEVFTVSPSSPSSLDNQDPVVVKIIPLHMPILEDGTGQLDEDADMPQTSIADDVRREIEITRSLSALGGNGYPSLRGAYIVQGSYPTQLLQQWDTWKSVHGDKCQNIRPHSFPDNQLYALVCLSHGGNDLETVKLKSWTEAASVLWQVAEALAQAEERLQFEHRDLHWGNILVAPASATGALDEQLGAISLDEQDSPHTAHADTVPACLAFRPESVRATIIDFTLSRATLPQTGEVLSGGLEDDSIFQGTGDYQYECYRIMKTLVNDSWDAYHATTNLVWLHYLVQKLLYEKKLKKPSLRNHATATGHRNVAIVASLPGSPRAARSGAGRDTRRTVVQAKSSSSTTAAATKKANDAFTIEKTCYEALQAAEGILKAAVEVAIQAAEAAAAAENTNRAGKPRRRSAKTSDVESVHGTPDLLFRNAGDFVEWWRSE